MCLMKASGLFLVGFTNEDNMILNWPLQQMRSCMVFILKAEGAIKVVTGLYGCVYGRRVCAVFSLSMTSAIFLPYEATEA